MKVDYIDHMGSDLTVVNAARVSFAKQSEFGMARSLSERDQKLITYLAAHKHMSPFRHCFASFRVTAPIFVARQLAKHQVGLSWNEVSRRYVDTDPEFLYPDEFRARAENVKQGSSEEAVKGGVAKMAYAIAVDKAIESYKEMLAANVAPEMARMVLPQSMMTQWYWSGSLEAFSHIYNLRAKPDAQKECQAIAVRIGEMMKDMFPHSWEALTNG